METHTSIVRLQMSSLINQSVAETPFVALIQSVNSVEEPYLVRVLKASPAIHLPAADPNVLRIQIAALVRHVSHINVSIRAEKRVVVMHSAKLSITSPYAIVPNVIAAIHLWAVLRSEMCHMFQKILVTPAHVDRTVDVS